MNEDPDQIAHYLTEQHGAEGALEAIFPGIDTAHADGDNYRLSVWREVKRALRARMATAENQPEHISVTTLEGDGL